MLCSIQKHSMVLFDAVSRYCTTACLALTPLKLSKIWRFSVLAVACTCAATAVTNTVGLLLLSCKLSQVMHAFGFCITPLVVRLAQQRLRRNGQGRMPPVPHVTACHRCMCSRHASTPRQLLWRCLELITTFMEEFYLLSQKRAALCPVCLLVNRASEFAQQLQLPAGKWVSACSKFVIGFDTFVTFAP